MKQIRVYIPSELSGDAKVQDAVKHLAMTVGGATASPGMGIWYDKGQAVMEDVLVSEFITDRDVDNEVQLLIEAMHAAGEKSVLVTRQDIEARFVTPPTRDWEDR